MAINTSPDLKSLYPDQTFNAEEVMPEALIFQLTTLAGAVEGDAPVVRIPYVAADPEAGFVDEGAKITESDPVLDELTVSTDKVAVLTRTSNEAMRNSPGSNGVLSTSLRRAVTVKGNNALLSNPGNPTGLMGLAGISDGGTLGTNLDAVDEAIAAIEVAGGKPTHIVANPADWAKVRALKSGDGSNIPLLGAPAEQTEKQVFGLEVITTPSLAPGTILITSKGSIYSAAGELNLAVSPDHFFDYDSTAIRATWRFGWAVIDPKHIAKVTVASE